MVDWDLPLALIAANVPVFLGVYPVSANATGYWNLNGAAPPQLIIDYQ